MKITCKTSSAECSSSRRITPKHVSCKFKNKNQLRKSKQRETTEGFWKQKEQQNAKHIARVKWKERYWQCDLWSRRRCRTRDTCRRFEGEDSSNCSSLSLSVIIIIFFLKEKEFQKRANQKQRRRRRSELFRKKQQRREEGGEGGGKMEGLAGFNGAEDST